MTKALNVHFLSSDYLPPDLLNFQAEQNLEEKWLQFEIDAHWKWLLVDTKSRTGDCCEDAELLIRDGYHLLKTSNGWAFEKEDTVILFWCSQDFSSGVLSSLLAQNCFKKKMSEILKDKERKQILKYWKKKEIN